MLQSVGNNLNCLKNILQPFLSFAFIINDNIISLLLQVLVWCGIVTFNDLQSAKNRDNIQLKGNTGNNCWEDSNL